MPPYPARLINEGETVVLDLKPHWWFFVKHVVTGVGLLAVFVLWLGPAGESRWLGYPVGLALVVWAGWLLHRYLVWTYTHFVVTDRRVIARSGIVTKRGTEIPLDRINNIDFSQRIWERVIGAGDLGVESAGKDGQSHFENVRHPDLVQQEIYRQMEANARRKASWQQERPASAPAPTPAPAPAATGIADQIEQLARLRDAGRITAQEYDAKKAELLQRM